MDLYYSVKQLDDITLLEELCSREDDEIHYKFFVERFLPAVKEECARKCKARRLDPNVGLQISHETFEKVRQYKSFRKDKINLPNPNKAIFVYLIRISVSLFNDYHRKEQKREIKHKTYFEDILDVDETKIDLRILKTKKELTLFIWEKLNAKEKKVILTDIEYKKYQQYLPDDVTASLALEMKVKKDTIRKIRERAIEKIKTAIHEINQP